jgi:type II secretory pathway pseudopilin PulG
MDFKRIKKEISKVLTFNNSKGFTLLLSLVVIGIILTMATTIFSLISSEIEFAILSRESQRSLFAADAGAECALFWDLKRYAFSTTSPGTINCAQQQNLDIASTEGPDDIFSFSLTFANGTCADVVVDKTTINYTVILSYGYNMGSIVGGVCESNDPRLVERALRVIY